MPANNILAKPYNFGDWSIANGTVRDHAVTPRTLTGLQRAAASTEVQAENRGELLKLAIVVALIWAGFALYDAKGG